ncbi:unnamed protein product [Larinioides sclopetarius]|uniref:EGF-like domain-containing protein n=1 Tax=Larinioides sclopetarius TaxID=280406 RepID=A0AAV2BL44_9ARAC
MEKTIIFSITVVLCFGKFITSAAEVSEIDVSISQTETVNYIPVDTAVNKEFHFNGSELGMARADHCDCGQGFNCTFKWAYNILWEKTCICPDGYFFNDIYSSKCIPECSRKRPCKYDGTCSYYGAHKMCACPWETKGFLCEEIECGSKCQNRLEVDCLYDQFERVVYCSCKNQSLYYDEEANICRPCLCENGYCDYEYVKYNRKLVCRCFSGYKNFNGYCKECTCGSGECEFNSNGQKICKCLDGFYEKEGICKTCDCHSLNDMKTKCELTGNTKRCFCQKGFKDVLGHCEDINECETNNTCHPSATCYNIFGGFFCRCPNDYEGTDGEKVEPGEVCEDIDECDKSPNHCWFFDNVKCVNLPGSYKCECFQGYEPRTYSDEPHQTTCVRTSKNVGPAMIVVGTTLVLMLVSYLAHVRVKKRAARSN